MQMNSRDIGLTALLYHKQGIQPERADTEPSTPADMSALDGTDATAAETLDLDRPTTSTNDGFTDARTRFKLFLQDHKQSGELAEEVVSQVE